MTLWLVEGRGRLSGGHKGDLSRESFKRLYCFFEGRFLSRRQFSIPRSIIAWKSTKRCFSASNACRMKENKWPSKVLPTTPLTNISFWILSSFLYFSSLRRCRVFLRFVILLIKWRDYKVRLTRTTSHKAWWTQRGILVTIVRTYDGRG